jgi:hypothetical protein
MMHSIEVLDDVVEIGGLNKWLMVVLSEWERTKSKMGREKANANST